MQLGLYRRIAVNVPSATDGMVTSPVRLFLSNVPSYNTFERLPSSSVGVNVLRDGTLLIRRLKMHTGCVVDLISSIML